MAEFIPATNRMARHKRAQSVMANQFSAHLDDLFSIDKGLDTTLRQVENKRQSVYIQQRELEDLQERIRAAEARLGQNDSSDDNDSDNEAEQSSASKRRATNAAARLPSVFAIAETTLEEEPAPAPPAAKSTGAQTPVSTTSADYVVVRRPRPGPRKHPRVDSHIEVSSKENSEVDDEDSEEESSEAESSEEEEDSEEESSEEE